MLQKFPRKTSKTSRKKFNLIYDVTKFNIIAAEQKNVSQIDLHD